MNRHPSTYDKDSPKTLLKKRGAALRKMGERVKPKLWIPVTCPRCGHDFEVER